MKNKTFLASLTAIPEHELCELACSYAIADELTESDSANHLAHMLNEHNCVEAGELMLALLKFQLHCGTREAKLFREHGITERGCFTPEDDVSMLAAVESKLNELRTSNAVSESTTATRH